LTELARYEAAERAIAAAEAVDEVLEIRSQAAAWSAYARQAKNKDLEIRAARIRFRAERRLGDMLILAKAAGHLAEGRPRNCSGEEQFSDAGGAGADRAEAELGTAKPLRVTLQEAGIDRKLSSRAQRLAAMDAAEFEQALERQAEEMRSGQARVAMDLLKIGAEEKGRAHRRNLAAVLSEQSITLPTGKRYPANYIDCPWERKGGIGDRAYENHYPTMTWPEILAFLRKARDTLLPDAWSFFWIPRAHLLTLVEIEIEVTVVETGEVTLAKVMMPLAWACAQALGMDSYSTCFVWTKTDAQFPDDSGSGLIAWDQDELLLLFKRGRGLPKPAGSEKYGSNHRERPREHSRKPDHYRRMIATMVGCDDEGRPLPVLEMFARVDAKHPLPPGWDACGNQAGAPPIEIEPDAKDSSFAAGMPSDAGETVTAAANATSDGASVAAAVADVVTISDNQVVDRAPYDADDVVAIDQLAGSEWLRPVELDALQLTELEQLTILSDFCHPKRAAMQDVLGASWQAREMAYQSGGQWQLREAGWSRLHALRDAVTAPPVVALTEPYRAPQMSLFDCPAPEIVDGALQTRLPVDDDELAEQLALIAVDAGGTIAGEMARHLCGKDYLHATTTALKVTELGRAFLAQLVGPASVQQQGDAR
jgi:N6-adenosine-specific RNA methylase IME4